MSPENLNILRRCGIFPSNPQDHGFMSELARYANTELIEYAGRPHIPMIPVIALFMDEEPKRKDKHRSTPKKYWENLRRAMGERGIELHSRIVQLKAHAQDGKLRLMDCGDVIACKRVLMYMRDAKPEGLRMDLLIRSDALLTYTTQNLFEGRSAYENEFYNRGRRLLTDTYEDLGYRGRR